MQSSKISIQNLSKSFGTKEVLKHINLDIAAQESLVIIGGSGSGKSVFIKTIIGLLLPDKDSTVVIDEENVTYLPIMKRTKLLSSIGVLFQGGALFDSLTIWENIAFVLLKNTNTTKATARKIAAEKLSMVGLPQSTLDLYPVELSGGMQKRAALARAIVQNPSIMFFDEPTSGLDPITSQLITELIKTLSHELKATAITITHDMRCAREMADKVAMLYGGSIIWHGAASTMENSGNAYVEQFVHGKAEGPITQQA